MRLLRLLRLMRLLRLYWLKIWKSMTYSLTAWKQEMLAHLKTLLPASCSCHGRSTSWLSAAQGGLTQSTFSDAPSLSVQNLKDLLDQDLQQYWRSHCREVPWQRAGRWGSQPTKIKRKQSQVAHQLFGLGDSLVPLVSFGEACRQTVHTPAANQVHTKGDSLPNTNVLKPDFCENILFLWDHFWREAHLCLKGTSLWGQGAKQWP